jgi:hypothetical protein
LPPSPTQGAAITYRIEERNSGTLDDEHPHWDRYDGRLRLDPGTWTVSAKAVR